MADRLAEGNGTVTNPAPYCLSFKPRPSSRPSSRPNSRENNPGSRGCVFSQSPRLGSCARAAQAKAAYESADEVGVNHVGEVAEMVYAHRVHTVPFGKGGPNLNEVISRMIGQ